MVWLHGEWVWAALLAPMLLAILLRAHRKQKAALAQFAPWLYRKEPSWRHHILIYGATAAWLLGLVTALGPAAPPDALGSGAGGSDQEDQLVVESGQTEELQSTRVAHDVILLLDASASMAVTDTRLGVARLEVAKEILDTLIGQLDGQSVAIYAFTSELTTVVPLTLDYLYARLMLRQVEINCGDAAGTDLMEAFDTVRRRHARGGTQKARTVLLVTDGGDTRLEAAKASDRSQQIEALASRLEAPSMPLTVVTIGIGSHQGEVIPDVVFDGKPVHSSLDEELLKRLASIGEGAYYFANDTSSYVLADRLTHHLNLAQERVETMRVPEVEVQRTEEGSQEMEYQSYFRVPLVAACLLLSVVMLLEAV